jgi:DNA repair protein RadC
MGTGEMAQHLKALTALLKVQRSSPSNHMVVHNHPEGDLTPSSGVSEDSYSVLTYNKQTNKQINVLKQTNKQTNNSMGLERWLRS